MIAIPISINSVTRRNPSGVAPRKCRVPRYIPKSRTGNAIVAIDTVSMLIIPICEKRIRPSISSKKK
jgi:hypothetical protein